MGLCKKGIILFFLSIWTLSCGSHTPSKDNLLPFPTPENEHLWRPLWDGSSWVVTFSEGIVQSSYKHRILKSFSATPGPLGALLVGQTSVRPIVSALGSASGHRPWGGIGFALVTMPKGAPLQWSQQKRLLEGSPGVVRAEPNLKSKLYNTTGRPWPRPDQVPTTQNMLFKHWADTPTHAQLVRLPQALERVRDMGIAPKPVVIAVLDTVIDFSHSNLQGQFFTPPGYTKPIAINATTGETIEIDSAPSPIPSNAVHGTHVAAIIAGNPSPTNKVIGICSTCQILPVQVARISMSPESGGGEITDADQLTAFETIMGLRNPDGTLAVDGLSMSYGKAMSSWALEERMAYFRRMGVFLVGAAGNENSSLPSHPAASPGVIGVAGVNWNEEAQGYEKAWYSNWGGWVKMAAPSGNVASASPKGYSFSDVIAMDGTSQAAPQVTGAIGFILAAHRDTLTPLQAANRVLRSANRGALYSTAASSHIYGGTVNGATFSLLGSGVLDLEAALTATDLPPTDSLEERAPEVAAGCVANSVGGQTRGHQGPAGIPALAGLALWLYWKVRRHFFSKK